MSCSFPGFASPDPAAELTPPPGTAAWRLDAPDRNGPDGLVLAPWPEAEQALRPGQVRVELRTAGLNFRDALISLGIYPGEGQIGSEGAGIVTEVATDVTGVVPGDHVMGLFDGIGPVAVTSRARLVPVPRGWSFAQAAAVPLVFVTAYLRLWAWPGSGWGNPLLIHAATGGVGMAALQLARHLAGRSRMRPRAQPSGPCPGQARSRRTAHRLVTDARIRAAVPEPRQAAAA